MLQLPLWEESKAYRLKTINNQKPVLRIVLKTKNEPLLLEKWIKHHIGIVGAHNLLILDNMSDHPDVLRIYERYRDRIDILQFVEFHDDIHDTTKFPVLYAALRAGSTYYTVFDTDEFLYFYDNGRFHADPGILRKLANVSPKRSVPTVWLYTAPGYERRPMCSGRQAFVDGLIWGKTIFRSAANLSGLVCHNCQLPMQEFMEPSPVRGFFLFHLALLSPKQRIRANLAKLIAVGFAEPTDSLEAVLEKDPGSANMYIQQIRQLLDATEPATSDDDPVPATVIRLLPDGTAMFASKPEQVSFNGFIGDFAAICAAAFAPPTAPQPG